MAGATSSEPLGRRIRELGPWFHNLDLGDGVETAPDHPLGDFPRQKWREIERWLPADLEGRTALDIGCNAGFYSFELARRGARVTAIDSDPHYLRQARWAAQKLDPRSRVRFLRRQVYELAALGEAFDVVLFLGVFYHLRYPLLGLDVAARLTRELLVFQTLTMPGEHALEKPADPGLDGRAAMLDPGWPKMAFVEGELAGDPTNWWAPNHAAVEAMLRSSGLEVIERPGHEIYLCRPAEIPNPQWEEQYRAIVAGIAPAGAGRTTPPHRHGNGNGNRNGRGGVE